MPDACANAFAPTMALFGPDLRVRAVVVAAYAQGHDDLLERRVATAFADPVHADLDLMRAGFYGREGVRDRETKVVVAVHGDAEAAVVRGQRAADREHELRELGRLRVPDRVGDVDVARARPGRGLADGDEEVDVGARRVLRREFDLIGMLGRPAHGADRAVDALAGRDAEHPLEVDLARADEDVDALALRRCERASRRVDVAVGRAGERRDGRAGHLARDRVHRVELLGRGGREAGLDSVHVQLREGLGHPELVR